MERWAELVVARMKGLGWDFEENLDKVYLFAVNCRWTGLDVRILEPLAV